MVVLMLCSPRNGLNADDRVMTDRDALSPRAVPQNRVAVEADISGTAESGWCERCEESVDANS